MAKKLFKPNNVVKSTIYIGSGKDGKALVKMINAEMERTGLDFSPLLIKAFVFYHELVEREAERQRRTPAELLNYFWEKSIAAPSVKAKKG